MAIECEFKDTLNHALNLIDSWVREKVPQSSNVKIDMRQNERNMVVRYHLPTLAMTDEEFDAFSEMKPKSPDCESLTLAKGFLSAIGGRLHAYRSVKGGTCFDVVLKDDSEFQELKAKILQKEKEIRARWPGHDQPSSPDFFDRLTGLIRRTLLRLPIRRQKIPKTP